MAFLDNEFTGDVDQSLVTDWVLDEARKSDFEDYLIASEGVTRARARQIWTQSREYHVGDTGTATARPQRQRIQDYWGSRLNDTYGFFPVVIGDSNVQSVLNSNPNANYRPRLNSASRNAANTYGFAESTGLAGIIFIAAWQGNFVVFVPDNSP
ncbi:MAG: hypothetical protein EYR95_16145 [Phormidium sp. SL48-SHIP]|nr:MAG: hypothetical protein EYR95_16145 [Phormidium sp. SL48-SHIP]